MATTAAAVYEVGVPQGASTAVPGWYWVVVEGACTARVEGASAVANGAFLKAVNAGTGLILDHATVPTANAAAIARQAVPANTPTAARVHLIGGRVPIPAT